MSNLSEFNETLQLNYLKQNFKSNSLLDISKKLNIFATLILVVFGLIGHSLIIFVFGQKRFRTNSSNVFLLCLAINDSLFLVIHFFEDTIRAYKEIYIDQHNNNLFYNQIIQMLNLTDKFEILCHLVNYLRYALRFISSYILVVFTLQRLSIVKSPLSNKFKSKKSAWVCCFIITIVAFLINGWAPFLFKLRSINSIKHCDIDKKWANEYFQITTIYICITMLIPIIIIFTSNFLIIINLVKADSKRATSLRINNPIQKRNPLNMKSLSNNMSVSNTNMRSSLNQSSKSVSVYVKPHYSSVTHIANNGGVLNNRKINSKNSTKILLFTSFVFICLNLPYLVTWFMFYYEIESNQFDYFFISNDYLFTAVQITEIIHMVNYSILFYVYCVSGSKFRNQLKFSRILDLF